MTSLSSRPVARLSSPGDIVATVPALCGFPPQESVVVLSLRGPRRRLGLTVRLDLPPPELEADVGELLAERLVHDGGAAAVVAVFAAERRPGLVEAVVASCASHGVTVTEGLHVHGGRWTSYLCGRACCPPEGTPVPGVPSLVESQRVLSGCAVLSSRDELVRSLAAPLLLEAAACAQALAGAAAHPADGPAVARQALAVVTGGGVVDRATAAQVAVALHDVQVRDEVASWGRQHSDALLALAEQVARLTVPPYDAPVCTLLAWVAYARGDGARANVALDRALATDGGYPLALLLRAALDGGLPPRLVRRAMRAGRRRGA